MLLFPEESVLNDDDLNQGIWSEMTIISTNDMSFYSVLTMRMNSCRTWVTDSTWLIEVIFRHPCCYLPSVLVEMITDYLFCCSIEQRKDFMISEGRDKDDYWYGGCFSITCDLHCVSPPGTPTAPLVENKFF